MRSLLLTAAALSLLPVLVARGAAAAGEAEGAKKSGGDTASGKPEEKPEASVFVSGNVPALLDRPLSPLSQMYSKVVSWGGSESQDRYLWTCFTLRPRADAGPGQAAAGEKKAQGSVTISALGLGASTFSYKVEGGCPGVHEEGSGPDQLCKVFAGGGGGWTKQFSCWKEALELPLDQPERTIGVRVPVGLVQQAGGSVEGKIVIQEPSRKPLEIPLKIERPADPFSTGLEWFGGIAIPALLSFGLGYGASKMNTKLSSRTEQQQGFGNYKDESFSELNAFFKTFYPAQCKLYPNDWRSISAQLIEEMRRTKMLRHVPQKERRALEKALVRGDEADIKKHLVKLFKEWEGAIKSPDLGQDAGG